MLDNQELQKTNNSSNSAYSESLSSSRDDSLYTYDGESDSESLNSNESLGLSAFWLIEALKTHNTLNNHDLLPRHQKKMNRGGLRKMRAICIES